LAGWLRGGSTLPRWAVTNWLTILLVRRVSDALRGAVVLAGWVGAGQAVTAKGVLRRAVVPAAGPALGVELPEWVRSAADVSALHWPICSMTTRGRRRWRSAGSR
jgi:hypothetical protein